MDEKEPLTSGCGGEDLEYELILEQQKIAQELVEGMFHNSVRYIEGSKTKHSEGKKTKIEFINKDVQTCRGTITKILQNYNTVEERTATLLSERELAIVQGTVLVLCHKLGVTQCRKNGEWEGEQLLEAIQESSSAYDPQFLTKIKKQQIKNKGNTRAERRDEEEKASITMDFQYVGDSRLIVLGYSHHDHREKETKIQIIIDIEEQIVLQIATGKQTRRPANREPEERKKDTKI